MLRTLFALLVLALVLCTQVTPALASCTYHTYWINGRMVSCNTCCFGNVCNTSCF